MLLEFINSHENWQKILSTHPYNIKIKQNDKYFLLKYDNILSPFGDPIVNESRGCIIYFDNLKNEWVYVCRPFVRFFNYGDDSAATIDWDSAKVYDKIDGTLIKVWFHDNHWHISTSSMIDAADATCGDLNFKDLFFKALPSDIKNIDDFMLLTNPDNVKNRTYLFELVSPFNRLVVSYDNTELYYLGEIENETGEEYYHPEEWKEYIHKLNIYNNINQLNKAITAANSINADDGEGFVVVDKYYNRIKIKGEDYLKSFHIRNNGLVTKARVVESLKNNTFDELLAYNNDKKDYILKVKENIEFYGNKLNYVLFLVKTSGSLSLPKKKFALWLLEQKDVKPFVMSYLFYVKNNYDKKLKYEDGFNWLINYCPTKKLIEVLDYIEQ